MSIAQVDTSPYAQASGTLVLNVPNELKDNVTQIISLMQVMRIGGSTTVDVTPQADLSSWAKTEGTDNVTYTTLFSTASYLPLIHGSNELQIVLTVNDESKIQTMGTVGYDACIDSDTMCLSLSWTDGLDPDLHSYYFPDWTYNEETTNAVVASDGSSDLLFTDTDHIMQDGDEIQFTTTGTLPGNITADINYYVNARTDTTFKVETVVDGGNVQYSSTAGSGVSYSSFDNSSRGERYWVYSNAANKKYSATGDTIQFLDGTSPSDNETQIWATHGQKVGNGTYLFYVEDVSETDVQNFKLVLSGPGLSDNLTYGPYDFKVDLDNSTTEAVNPQAVFFIQVDNNSIVRSVTISVGDNLSSLLVGPDNISVMQWTGSLQNSVVK